MFLEKWHRRPACVDRQDACPTFFVRFYGARTFLEPSARFITLLIVDPENFLRRIGVKGKRRGALYDREIRARKRYLFVM
jgi:hypothetical protein